MVISMFMDANMMLYGQKDPDASLWQVWKDQAELSWTLRKASLFRSDRIRPQVVRKKLKRLKPLYCFTAFYHAHDIIYRFIGQKPC